jgi:N-acetylglucosamine-6-sulfatase
MPKSPAPLDRRGFLAAGAAALASARCGRERRPNVVVILTDDQRWDCLSCAGHPFLKTPNLDRIAAEGVRFSNAFITTSLCSPSRASYLSGLYAHTHQVINNFTEYPVNLPSYPRNLKSAGYRTAYIGKWHMGEENDNPRPGFDYWASHKGQGKYYDTEFNINGRRDTLKGYYTHRVTDLAVQWIRENRNPYCLMVGHKAPHGVWLPESKYEHIFDSIDIRKPPTARDTGFGKPDWIRQRVPTWHGIDGPLYGTKDYNLFVRTYLGTILSVDDSVGRIYDALRASGELDNTVLVFASDNGFMLGEHGAIDKRCMYEESIRVPMLVRYPALVPAPRVVDEMVLNVDLAPSLLDICGAPPLGSVHGRSWKSLVRGDARNWRSSWYYEYNYEKEFPYTPNVRGVRTAEWKYMHSPTAPGKPDAGTAELYNLKADPQETRNLIDDPASKPKLDELRSELARLQQATGALPDRMPGDTPIGTELPEQSIR